MNGLALSRRKSYVVFPNTDLLRDIMQAHLNMALPEEVVVSVVIMNSSPLSKQINEKREKFRQHGFSNCGMRTTTTSGLIKIIEI